MTCTVFLSTTVAPRIGVPGRKKEGGETSLLIACARPVMQRPLLLLREGAKRALVLHGR